MLKSTQVEVEVGLELGINEYLRMRRTWFAGEVMPVILLGNSEIETERVLRQQLKVLFCKITKLVLIEVEELVLAISNMPSPTYNTHENL